jgi:hypothetical protein
VTGGPPGCIRWNEQDIKPGFHECSNVEITNDGNMEGTLYILVRDITGSYDLGKYMFFDVQNARIIKDIDLPATMYDFPDDVYPVKYISIPAFKPGETITLNWCWEFIETNQPQNEAQGKSIGFTIYYTLRAPDLPCADDVDGDGVCDSRDVCQGTTKWYAEDHLLPNHYDSSNMNMISTHGCSCDQILSCKPGNNNGEYQYGCTGGTLTVWEQTPNSWIPNCVPIEGEEYNPFNWWKLHWKNFFPLFRFRV